MKILSVAAEVAPFSAVGGLARGIAGLNTALKLSHDIKLFTPLYGSTITALGANTVAQLKKNDQYFYFDYPHFPIIFYDSPAFFSKRTNIYGHSDDYLRFYNFSLACADWLLNQFENKLWFPNIIHTHDWHAGYLSEIIKTFPKYKKLSSTPIFFTIHNFKYQGDRCLQYLGPKLQDKNKILVNKSTPTQLRYINPLLRGIIYSDQVNTVSPNYALECLTPDYGYNLAWATQQHSSKISGILNGVDLTEFDPKIFTDPRPQIKSQLQKEFGLSIDKQTLLCAFVGRLSSQKGLELIPPAIDHLITEGLNLQLIIQGSGDDIYYDLFHDLQSKYPDKIGLNYIHDKNIPKFIYAGADLLLVPSQFEPGGNVVLEALRFGCVPLVRDTGGMTNSITSYNLETVGNGFKFRQFNWVSLANSIYSAHQIFHSPKLWSQLVINCVSFYRPWKKVAIDYIQWFKQYEKDR
jgi:starch synthase